MPSPGSRRPAPHVVVLAVGLGAAAVFLLRLGSELYFFADEWDFLVQRRVTLGGDEGVLHPHNEHWSTIPILLYRLVWSVVGLDHYGVYVAMPIATLVLMCVGLHLLLRRTGAAPWPAVIASLVLAWGGFGEDTLWAFQVGFLGSLMFGVLAVLAVEVLDRTPLRIAVGAALTLASLMCSGLGLPALVWVGCFALLRRGWVVALGTTVPPALLYVAWYAAYGRAGDDPDNHTATLGESLSYVWAGMAHIWEATTSVPGSGGVILLALLGFALFDRSLPALRAVAISGFAALFAGFSVISYSRAFLGTDQAMSNRYVAMGLIFTLPALALVLTRLAERLPGSAVERTAIVAVLTALVLVSGTASTLAYHRTRADQHDVGRLVLAAVELTTSGETLLRDSLPVPGQPAIDIAPLVRPAVRPHLPDRAPGDQAVLDVRARMQADVSGQPGDMPFTTRVTGTNVAGDLDLSSCAEVATFTGPGGYVEVPGGPRGVQVGVVVPVPTIQLQLVSGDRVSAPTPVDVVPNQLSYLRTVAPDVTMRFTFDSAAFGVCGDQTP